MRAALDTERSAAEIGPDPEWCLVGKGALRQLFNEPQSLCGSKNYVSVSPDTAEV